jgi:hypothetical protein
MRHTFVSELLNAGMRIECVQRLILDIFSLYVVEWMVVARELAYCKESDRTKLWDKEDC